MTTIGSHQWKHNPVIALAWLLTQPSVVAPIASATSLDQLQELVQAPALKLDGDALGLLDAASTPDH